jgi:RpiR family carbohydrate utilization transcriptional regulator
MLSQIARAVPDLSRAEKRVASWVLDHPKQATSATLAHIANECGTSEPTVLRFCRRMGMKGFRELGVRVAESLSVPGSYVHRDVNPDDSISDAAIKVMDASIQSLAEMRAQLSSFYCHTPAAGRSSRKPPISRENAAPPSLQLPTRSLIWPDPRQSCFRVVSSKTRTYSHR